MRRTWTLQHLDRIAERAALADRYGEQMEFRHYLYDQIAERVRAGRSTDCDEYRALCGIAARADS